MLRAVDHCCQVVRRCLATLASECVSPRSDLIDRSEVLLELICLAIDVEIGIYKEMPLQVIQLLWFDSRHPRVISDGSL